MIFQVAYIPSNHIRLAIYKLLGCRMGKGNAIHFGTELRGIENIQLGGGYYCWRQFNPRWQMWFNNR